MRALAVLVAVLVLAGCTTPAPPPAPPATHATDCREAAGSATCTAPTADSPLEVATVSMGNRTQVGLRLTNNGTLPLVFDTEPPAYWVYVRTDGRTEPVASGNGTAPGATLAPGENRTLVLHYGRHAEAERGNDVRPTPALEPRPWPSSTYRVCFGAHPGEEPGWVRGCKDFRIR